MSEQEPLFNLPITAPVNNRGRLYAEIVSQYAEGRALDILEIGVFKAGLLKALRHSTPSVIASYTGVDPYIGDETDPYHKSYWHGDKSEADRQYEASMAIFVSFGASLLRERSAHFFASTTQQFDVIIVDGDHRVGPTLKDLHDSLAHLRPGGLLLLDDYGNSDTPEVTRAAVRFIAEAGDFYDAAGYRPLWFQNAGKPAPIQLSVLYWRKRS